MMACIFMRAARHCTPTPWHFSRGRALSCWWWQRGVEQWETRLQPQRPVQSRRYWSNPEVPAAPPPCRTQRGSLVPWGDEFGKQSGLPLPGIVLTADTAAIRVEFRVEVLRLELRLLGQG